MAGRRKGQTLAPSDLTPEQARALWRWKETKYPWMTREQVRAGVDDCLEWHTAKGTTWVDWRLVCQRWIREQVERGKIREPSPLDSLAQERERQARAERRRYIREAQAEMESLGPLDLAVLLAEGRERRGF